MDENKLETELQELGLNAPRLSPTLINETILTEQYYVFPGTVMTAKDKAREQIWALEGYTLRNALCGRAPFNSEFHVNKEG